MVVYPEITQSFNASLQGPTGILIHVIILIAASAFSFYGLRAVVKYVPRISKNAHLLMITFALMTAIPTWDLFEHLAIYPGDEFWHHMHIFASIAAFYFLYRFVMRIDDEEKEDSEKSIVTLLVIAIAAVAFTTLHGAFTSQNGSHALFFMVYGAFALITAVFTYNLFQMIGKMKKMESGFSLRAFLMSMIPLIALALFLVTATALIVEFIADTTDMINQPVVLMLIASANVSYLLLGISLFGFGYMSQQIQRFYAPIDAFVKNRAKKAK